MKKPNVLIFSIVIGFVGVVVCIFLFTYLKGDQQVETPEIGISSNFSKINMDVPTIKEQDTSDLTVLVEKEIEKDNIFDGGVDTVGNAIRKNDVDEFMATIGKKQAQKFDKFGLTPSIEEFDDDNSNDKGNDKSKFEIAEQKKTPVNAKPKSGIGKPKVEKKNNESKEVSKPSSFARSRKKGSLKVGQGEQESVVLTKKAGGNSSREKSKEVEKEAVIRVKGIVYGNQVVEAGKKVSFITSEPVEFSSGVLPVGSVISGNCSVGSNRLTVDIKRVSVNGEFLAVQGYVEDAYDGDIGLLIDNISDEGQVGRGIGKDLINSGLSKVGLGIVRDASNQLLTKKDNSAQRLVTLSGDEEVIIIITENKKK